ncbi:MAG: helix-turn-helix domain-containing protein [Sphingobacteriales bacterium]
MESNQIQETFLLQIKSLLKPHQSLVDEVADLLNISIDSAYRRIRGEKQLSFEEIIKLASHYKISLDHLLHLQSDAFIFTGRLTNNFNFTYENWLNSVADHLKFFLSFQPNHLFYLVKEIPFYYYFLIPEIAAFKSFFFMKSIFSMDEYKAMKFSVKDDFKLYYELTQKIANLFSDLPSTEIWSIENITSTLHQIEFYRVTGAMQSDEDALVLLDKFDLLINHLEKQAEYGVKLRLGQDPATSRVPCNMFVNELILADNMHLIQLGDKYMTAINHSVLNFITTMNETFNAYVKKNLDNLTQKSTLISKVNERDRLMFFNRLRTKVNNARKLVTQ